MTKRGRENRIAAALALAWACAVPLPAGATSLEALRFSPDITVILGDVTVSPQRVAQTNLAGEVALVVTNPPPPTVRITAYELLTDGDQLLSFDTTVLAPPGFTAGPADVVRYHEGLFTLEFDGSANGIPDGVIVDAVSAAEEDGSLLLSFDTTVMLGPLTIFDEDLVRFAGGSYSLFFDGSAARVPPELDLDGAHLLGNGNLLLSFDGSAEIDAVRFNDEDALEYDPSADTWKLAYDGSGEDADWAAADLVALFAETVCLADVDKSGRPPEIATDATYIARHLLGLPPVPASFRALDPTIPPDEEIAANIDAIGSALDVDGNGIVEVGTDLIYAVRFAVGLDPVPPSFRALDPTIPPDSEIIERIGALCP